MFFNFGVARVASQICVFTHVGFVCFFCYNILHFVAKNEKLNQDFCFDCVF